MQAGTSYRAAIPLAAFPLVRCGDPRAVGHTVSSVAEVEQRRVDLPRGGPAFEFVANGVVIDGVQLFGIAFSAGSRVVSEPLRAVHVMLPQVGQLGFRAGDTDRHLAGPGSAVVFSPGEPVDLDWRDGAAARCLRIGDSVLDGFLRSHFPGTRAGDTRFLRWDGEGAATRSFVRVLGVLFDEIEASGALATRCARQWVELVLMTLLQTVPGTLAGRLPAPEAVPDARLRQVIDYALAHLDAPPTMADLLGVAGGSARSLQAAFQARFGVGPMTWLRGERLDRVRADLLRTEPGTTVVADVAARWGFYNGSHFTQMYKRRYGVLPSADLRHRTGPRP